MTKKVIKIIAIKDLKLADYNPKDRTEVKKLRTLIKSIAELGLIYPIVVDKNYNVIDGHRRIAALIELGFTTIECIVLLNVDKERTYADVNATARHFTGANSLSIWLKNPKAVTERVAKSYEELKDEFGLKLLQTLAKNGQSVRQLRLANSIANYIGVEENVAFKRKTARWLIRHRLASLVRSYMEMGHGAKQLENAIKSNKTIRVKYE